MDRLRLTRGHVGMAWGMIGRRQHLDRPTRIHSLFIDTRDMIRLGEPQQEDDHETFTGT
jgi:hypothetical protein